MPQASAKACRQRRSCGSSATAIPHWQVAYTYFSPSAETFAAGVGADVADCLPLDTPGEVARALDALRPSMLVFAKLDVWPELATQAAARNIPVALVAATVRPGSGRLRPVARALLAPAYRCPVHRRRDQRGRCGTIGDPGRAARADPRNRRSAL